MLVTIFMWAYLYFLTKFYMFLKKYKVLTSKLFNFNHIYETPIIFQEVLNVFFLSYTYL